MHTAHRAAGSCAPECAGRTATAVQGAAAADIAGREARSFAASTEPAGHAVFNPFATIGIAVQAPASVATQPVNADWTLPVAVLLVGFGLIGWLLRAMIQ
jgi:hypothetical protein